MLKSKINDTLSQHWILKKRQGASHTGGNVSVPAVGELIASLCFEKVAFLNIKTGIVEKFIPDEKKNGNVEPIVNFVLSPDGQKLVTFGRNSQIRVWDSTSGECKRNWKGQRLPVAVVDIDPSGTLVASGSTDKSLFVWDIDNGYATHSFRGHDAVISAVKFQPHPVSVQTLVSGDESGNIRIWDLISSSCIGSYSEHFSAITSLMFSPNQNGNILISGGRDKIVNLWDMRDIQTGAVKVKGRSSEKINPLRLTVNMNESIEDIAVQKGVESSDKKGEDSFAAIISGVGGNIRSMKVTVGSPSAEGRQIISEFVRVTNIPSLYAGVGASTGKRAASFQPKSIAEDELPLSYQIEHTMKLHDQNILVVTRDHNLIIMSPTFEIISTFTGYSDQILDVKYLGSCGNEVAMVTNSPLLRIVDTRNFNTRIFFGHTDNIISLSVSRCGRLIATASKDRTIRLWNVNTGFCESIIQGHTETVTAVTFPWNSALQSDGSLSAGLTWLASASKDRTLQLWQLEPLLERLGSTSGKSARNVDAIQYVDSLGASLKEGQGHDRLRSLAATVAHEKEVNCVVSSPNDRLLATGSQDKTIKLWALPSLRPVATLKGHKRGVWTLAFSPADQLLASGSADSTVRLWAVSKTAGFACLRTFEIGGNVSGGSVLALAFVRNGLQLLSAGSEGVVRLWNVDDGACVRELDEGHEDKISAIDTFDNSTSLTEEQKQDKIRREFVSVGSDSVLNVWEDRTAASASSAVLAAEKALLKQQELYTAMASRDYLRSISMTLELDQPGRCGDILQELLEIGPTKAGRSMVRAEDDYTDRMEREMAVLNSIDTTSTTSTSTMGNDGNAFSKEFADLVNTFYGQSLASVKSHDSSADSFGMNTNGLDLLRKILLSLDQTLLYILLGYIREWNAHLKHGLLAQRVLFVVLKLFPRRKLLDVIVEAKKLQLQNLRRDNETKMLPGIGLATIENQNIDSNGQDNSVDETSDSDAPLAPVTRQVHTGMEAAPDSSQRPTAVELQKQKNQELREKLEAPQGLILTATTELQALVNTLLPYTERHGSRIDRLNSGIYCVDAVLSSNKSMLPVDDVDTMHENALIMHNIGGSSAVVVDEESDQSDSSSDDEDVPIKKGWGNLAVQKSLATLNNGKRSSGSYSYDTVEFEQVPVSRKKDSSIAADEDEVIFRRSVEEQRKQKKLMKKSLGVTNEDDEDMELPSQKRRRA